MDVCGLRYRALATTVLYVTRGTGICTIGTETCKSLILKILPLFSLLLARYREHTCVVCVVCVVIGLTPAYPAFSLFLP